MTHKKRMGAKAGLIIELAIIVFVLLALIFYKVFPKMKKHCIEMCEKMEQAGIEPPPMGKWMLKKFKA